MKKQTKRLLLIVVLLISAGLSLFFTRQKTTAPDINVEPLLGKVQKCPTRWYQNDMPSPGTGQTTPEDRQYMIVDGKRMSLKDMDVEWVKSHCSVNSPSIVE